jgi:hypothetical protein
VEENELTWDGGDANPEPALDSLPPHIVGMREVGNETMRGEGERD